MSYIKLHWFGILVSTFVAWVLLVFVLVLFSPRQDLQGRGFIPCTETMADKMLGCEKNKAWCMLGAIVDNSFCDMKVVAKGFGSWITGQQSRPWSNYLFTPEALDDDFDEQAKSEYLQNNPDIEAEMIELKQLHEEIENEQLQSQQELLKQEQPQ